jgi:hypothetical protein
MTVAELAALLGRHHYLKDTQQCTCGTGKFLSKRQHDYHVACRLEMRLSNREVVAQ